MKSILDSHEVQGSGEVRIEGFIGPSHVSTLIGMRPYEIFATQYHRPVVIAGFEPLDVMQAVHMLVRQLNAGHARVENQFTRGVTYGGNKKAQVMIADVFELRPSFEWRGLGELPDSAVQIRQKYREFDAEHRFDVKTIPVVENAACQCPAILRGTKKPTDCSIFGTACTPRTPIGSCMVSSEGACAAYYKYRRPSLIQPDRAAPENH
jgi:hydrogenase expression/formation protein HypD